MAEALLGWARNIIYYMIFLSLAEHLLAGSSYGRYLRLFGGLVLVLVVLEPFGSLGDWETQTGSLFRQFTFKQESEELKKELFGMEEKRLDGITGQYREYVEEEIAALAGTEGKVPPTGRFWELRLRRRGRLIWNRKKLVQPDRCVYPPYPKTAR